MTLFADVSLHAGTFELAARITAAPGELLVLVGPNGAGKTTLLRTIAGLQRVDRGRIDVDGITLDDGHSTFVPPHRRNVGYVPHGNRLLPHLDAVANVAFGLRCRGANRREALTQARGWLDVVELPTAAHHRPAELSAGQAKRVALARALATRPRVLLLDEPFAGLDATTRREIRSRLRTFLESHDGIRIVVTHEPIDALAIADRIIVLEDGRITHDIRPDELRVRPRSRYVADLVGVNLYRGCLTATGLVTDEGVAIVATDAAQTGGVGFVTIHPRSVALHRENPEGSPRNVWRGRVSEIDDEGERLRVRIDGELAVVAEITPAAVAALGVTVGESLFASVKATDVSVYPS